MMDDTNDKQFALTLARGLEILRCFSIEKPYLSNRELADLTGLSKPTISRFTYTLIKLGYLETDTVSGKFQLGTAVLSLGYPLLASMSMRQLARPLLRELAEFSQGSASLGVRDRLSMVYVETSRHHSVFNIRLSDVGLSYPILSTAIGRAYLCGYPPAQRQAILNELRVKEPDQWARFGEATMQNIEAFHQRGYCVSFGEIINDIHGIAVPLPASGRDRPIAISCVVHSYQMSPEDIERKIGPRIVSVSRALQARAGA